MCNIAIYSVTLFCYTSCERGFCMEKWISKKELLAKTGISYGQLYRWKREKLIPDDWFIKRAAFTGQETFFPRERVLERISFILENKDRYALRELVEMLSPNPENRRYPAKALDAATSGLSSALARALCVEEWNHAQALCLLVASGARAMRAHGGRNPGRRARLARVGQRTPGRAGANRHFALAGRTVAAAHFRGRRAVALARSAASLFFAAQRHVSRLRARAQQN